MSGHDDGFERRRDPDSPLLYSVSKTVSFSAKIIAHRTNLGSMANPLLPKNPSPIMLAIVAFRFGFFFFFLPPITFGFGLQQESLLQQKYWARDFNHHLIKRLCGKGKAILIRLTGWLEDALTLRPIRPSYGEAPLEPGLVWVRKKLIETRYCMLICRLCKTRTT